MSDKKYIVIVDDHAMFRKGIGALINSFPSYEVLFDAANGRDFIEQLNAEQLPDIVLLDINMPEMDGFATATWIKTNYPEIKILALSTLDSDTSIIRMIKHGARGYVLKDAELSELKLAFSDVLSKGFFYNEIISQRLIQSVNQLVDETSSLNTFMALTKKELELLKLSCSEMTYREIASEMMLSEKTIDNYRDIIFRKLNVSSRVGMVMYAIKNGIVKL